MKTILVTGPIAGGKSTVCAILKSRGYAVYDSDSRAKALYTEIPGLKERICSRLDINFEDLDIIFRDRDRRLLLEDILYPLVREDFERWKKEQDAPCVIFESANAWGKSQFDGCFDEVWLVKAPYGLRAGRNPKVGQRDAAQNFDSVRPDVVITNDGSPEQLKQNLEKILWKRQI
ncbi:MAG: dephospho-CoA kinase [Bacteroidales bacterium]|nr:dephospho-CoA kinase [Bacteroidales bacterium]